MLEFLHLKVLVETLVKLKEKLDVGAYLTKDLFVDEENLVFLRQALDAEKVVECVELGDFRRVLVGVRVQRIVDELEVLKVIIVIVVILQVSIMDVRRIEMSLERPRLRWSPHLRRVGLELVDALLRLGQEHLLMHFFENGGNRWWEFRTSIRLGLVLPRCNLVQHVHRQLLKAVFCKKLRHRHEILNEILR